MGPRDARIYVVQSLFDEQTNYYISLSFELFWIFIVFHVAFPILFFLFSANKNDKMDFVSEFVTIWLFAKSITSIASMLCGGGGACMLHVTIRNLNLIAIRMHIYRSMQWLIGLETSVCSHHTMHRCFVIRFVLWPATASHIIIFINKIIKWW